MEQAELQPKTFVAELATRSGLAPEQVRRFVQAQAEMAYAHAANGFPIPGVGVVRVVALPAKTIEHKFGPRQGQAVQMPPRKKLEFRYSDAAKSALFGTNAGVADVFAVGWYPPAETDL